MQTLLPARKESSKEDFQDKDKSLTVRSLNLKYDDKLDHVRFLAAALVIVSHTYSPVFSLLHRINCDTSAIWGATAKLTGAWAIFSSFIQEGATAVGLFLTISGFLFARITAKSDIHPGKFYLNRILRIYPLYMTFILLAVYLSPGADPLKSLLMSALTLQNLPGATSYFFLTSHLWTIAVEFQIYLIFPILLAEYRSKGTKALLLFLAASIALKTMAYFISKDIEELAYLTVFGRIDQFLVGMILGYNFQNFKEKIKHPVFLFSSMAVLTAFLTYFHSHHSNSFANKNIIWAFFSTIEACVWGFFLVSYCASKFQFAAPISKALSFLGAISFSLYVTHYPICTLLSLYLSAPLYLYDQAVLAPIVGSSVEVHFLISVLFGFFVVLPVTIAASSLTYFAIEKPFMNRRVKYVISKSI